MEILLKGNYKSFTKVLITKSKKPTYKVLVNFHGLYGCSGDPRSKSKKLGDEVANNGLAHVVHFNSSRDWNTFVGGEWELMKKSFEGKTFDQELQDAKDALDMVLDQSKYLFDVNKNNIRFLFNGSSLGGVVATCLSDYFKYTDKIVLAGSGTKTVMDSKINENEILKRASKFYGDVLLLQGSNDDVVPLEAGEKLLSGYKNAKVEKIVIEGANHPLTKINGKDKKKAYKLYINSVARYLF